VEVRPWPGYAAQKNHAAALASHDWLLSLDADERVTPELAAEIRALLGTAGEPPKAGYRMPRVTYAFDRWIRTTDWYPDRQLRLYDRRAGRWNEQRRVHESVTLTKGADGGMLPDLLPGLLQGELQHLGYRGIALHVGTINRYTTLAAEDLAAQGRRAGAIDLLVQGPAAFLRNYLLRGGIRDGVPGFIVSAMNAYYVFLKFAKLRELESAAARPREVGERGPRQLSR
jgi:glycosyltransferase involved in cell wall biosynthesis